MLPAAWRGGGVYHKCHVVQNLLGLILFVCVRVSATLYESAEKARQKRNASGDHGCFHVQSLSCTVWRSCHFMKSVPAESSMRLGMVLVYPCDSGTSNRPMWNLCFFLKSLHKPSVPKRQNLGLVGLSVLPHDCQMLVCGRTWEVCELWLELG